MAGHWRNRSWRSGRSRGGPSGVARQPSPAEGIGEAFEVAVAECMRQFGWSSRTTPKNDFGADVVCRSGRDVMVIQCKCYAPNNSVGIEAVQEAYTAMPHYGANIGLVVFRGKPTRQARKLAESSGVELFHTSQLVHGWKHDRSVEWQRQREEAERARVAAAENARRAKAHAEEQRRAVIVAERRALVARRWALERARHAHALVAWQAHTKHRPRLLAAGGMLVLGALLSAAYFLVTQGRVPHEFTLGTTVAVGGGLLLVARKRAAPEEPTPPPELDVNETTIILCKECGQKLRVPMHRDLKVRCPSCKASWPVQT